jgi:hypothetical protein
MKTFGGRSEIDKIKMAKVELPIKFKIQISNTRIFDI